MKQFDVKSEKVIGENKFYIRPFAAYTATNLSGELASVITPIIASIAPLIANGAQNDDVSLLDIDAETAAPALARGFSALSGDKIENLMKKLLTKYKNITVELDDGSDAQILTDDLVNEVFCGEAQDMFVLAFEVIKVNFSGFFKKIGNQFGKAISTLMG
jgi:hypothetical protein